MDIGRIGIWTFHFEQQPWAAVAEAAAELDELGCGALGLRVRPVLRAFLGRASRSVATARRPAWTPDANRRPMGGQ